MRTLTTFYLFLLFISPSLFAQYTINQVYPSDGQLCSGLIVYAIGSEAGKVDIDLLFIETDQTEKLINNRYNWSGSGYFDNLCPGDYILRISDSFGCTKDLHFTIEGECNDIQMIRQPDIYPASSCEPDGQIQFGGPNPTGHFFSGLIDPVEFEWSNGLTGPIIKDISSGDYQLTVTDAKLCSKSFGFTVPGDNEVITVHTYSTPTCVGMAIGDVVAIASSESTSGPVEYLFFWPHNQQTDQGITSTLFHVAAGTYTVNVSNQDGSCPVTAQVTVGALQQSEQLQFSLGQMKPSCDNSNNGTIEISISGGVPGPPGFPEYEISSNKGIPYLSGSQVVQISPGNQTLTLTDFCGNSVSQEVEVDVWEPLNVFITEKGFENCDPSKGIIRFEANKNFTVNRHGNLFNSQPVPNSNNRHFVKYGYALAGIYDFYVTDENGCEYSFIDVDLQQPSSISTSAPTFLQEVLNCNEGKIIVPVLGGSPPYSYKWERENEIVSTENFLTGAEHGVYVLTVKDACLKVAKKVIDFRCDCAEQFTLRPAAGACNFNHSNYRFRIRQKDKDEILKPGLYPFKWLSPEEDDCYLRVEENGSKNWSGKRDFNVPHTGEKHQIELLDPRGCFWTSEAEIDFEPLGTIFPVTSSVHEPTLAFWTENDNDVEEVATDCWSGVICSGFQSNDDSKKFNYQPFSFDYPCAGGTIFCPDDQSATLVITVEGQPYNISNGSEKCGCLWEVQDIPYDPEYDHLFQDNLPILAVFDCDGEDIDISIIYNSCQGEVTTEQVAPCTYNYSCSLNGASITWPATYTPDYCLAIVECEQSLQTTKTYYVFEHCDDHEDCEEAFKILDYNNNPFGEEGITEVMMTELRDEGRCDDIENKHYRKFCLDPNYLLDCSVGPCLSDWIANLPEQSQPGTTCTITNPGFTDDPPSEGYPGSTGEYVEGQEGSSSTAIQLFPNPTTGATTLQFTRDPRESSYQLTIFNTYGHPLFEKKLDNLEDFETVEYYLQVTADFVPGIYFVEVYGTAFKEKLIEKLTVQ